MDLFTEGKESRTRLSDTAAFRRPPLSRWEGLLHTDTQRAHPSAKPSLQVFRQNPA